MLSRLGRNGYRFIRRLAIGVIGGTVVLVGVVMIVTPGPAFIVIPLGLALLALEFAWARHLLQRFRERMPAAVERFISREGKKERGSHGRTGD